MRIALILLSMFLCGATYKAPKPSVKPFPYAQSVYMPIIVVGGGAIPESTDVYNLGTNSFWWDTGFIRHLMGVISADTVRLKYRLVMTKSGVIDSLGRMNVDSLYADGKDTIFIKDMMDFEHNKIKDMWWAYIDTIDSYYARLDSIRVDKLLRLATNNIDSVGAVRFCTVNGVKLDFNSVQSPSTTYIGTQNDTSMLFIVPVTDYFAFEFDGTGGVRMDTGAVWLNYSSGNAKRYSNIFFCAGSTVGNVKDTLQHDTSTSWLTYKGGGINTDTLYSRVSKGDTVLIPVCGAVRSYSSSNGWAGMFIDTIGTDSLIFYVGTTRKGVPVDTL